jgi:hypothetical protein
VQLRILDVIRHDAANRFLETVGGPDDSVRPGHERAKGVLVPVEQGL